MQDALQGIAGTGDLASLHLAKGKKKKKEKKIPPK